jgi:hypothetical protein
MKRLLTFSVMLLIVLAAGCSNDSSGSGDPFGGGGGGGGAVTWTITTRDGAQGKIFAGQPSVAATITSVTLSLPAQGYQDVVTDNGQTIYQPGTAYDIGEYTGVATGQAWTLRFQGKIGNANGAAYDVTTNYTIP